VAAVQRWRWSVRRSVRRSLLSVRPSVVDVVVVACRATTAQRSILQRLIGHQAPTDKHRARAARVSPCEPACPLPRWTWSSSGSGRSDWPSAMSIVRPTTNARVALSRCQLCFALSVAEIRATDRRCRLSTRHPRSHPPDTPLWALSETILGRFRCPVIFITASSSDTTEIHNAPARPSASHHKDAVCLSTVGCIRWGFL